MRTEHFGLRTMLWGILLAVLVAACPGCGQNAQTSYDRGKEFLNDSQPEIAILFFSDALAADPRFPPALYDRGIAWLRTGQYPNAINDFSRFLYTTRRQQPYDPSLAPVYTERAGAYLAMAQFDDAIRDADFAISLDGSFTSAYFCRGGTYARRVDRSEDLADLAEPSASPVAGQRSLSEPERVDCTNALADFDKVIQLDAKHAKAHLERGRVHALTGNLDQAIADFADAYRLDPKNAEAHFRRGLALSQQQRVAEANQEFAVAAKLHPLFHQRASNPRVTLHLVSPPTSAEAADEAPALKSHELGLAELRKGEAAALAGETEQAAKSLDAAIAALTAAIQADSKNADARFYRGVAYVRTNQPDSAEEDLRQALQLRRNFWEAYLYLARLSWEKGGEVGVQQAASFAKQAAELAPGSAEAQRWLARAYLRQQRYPESANALKAVLELDPASRPEVLPQLTLALCEQAKTRADDLADASRWTQAIRLVNEALALDPENPALLLLRAQYAAAQGDLKAADEDYELASRIGQAPSRLAAFGSQLGEMHLRRARELEESGDAMAIVVHLAKAVAYRPEWRSKLSLQIAAFYRYLGGTFEMSRAYDKAAEYYEQAAEWTSADTAGDQARSDAQAIDERRNRADNDGKKAQQLRNRANHGAGGSGERAG
jgi:tetratricopeptide (TPR) repeat protein